MPDGNTTPTLGTFTVSDKTYGDSPFTLTPPSSNSTGSFSYTSSNTSVATISGNTVTIRGAGSATITAIQASTSNYTSASKSDTFTVNKANPTLGTFTVSDKIYGDSPFTLTPPSSNSTGSFSYTSSNTSVATISGNTVTIRGVGGPVTITATQASTSNYTSASKSDTFTVNKDDPVITNFTDISKTYGDSAFALNPQSNSQGGISYTSSDTSVATISGNTVTIRELGTTTITLTQLATTYYNSATRTITLTVNKKTPSITNFNDITKTYGDSVFTLNARSDSSGSISYTSSDTSVADIYGNNVTIIGAGSATITLTQSSTTYYNSIIRTITLTVNKKTPTLGAFAVSDKTYGIDTSFSLTPPSSDSSGSFSYTSSNTSVATISGNIVTIRAAGGPVTITATQSSTSNYASASKSDTFTVNKGTPTLGAFTVSDKTYGDAPFTLTPPASNSTGSFSYTSSNTSFATISNNTVTIRAAGGPVTITATQASTSNYNSASTSDTFTINKDDPIITNFTDISKTYGDSAFTLNPTSNSSGNFSYVSSNTSVATISGNTVTIREPGTTTITLTQASSSNYNEAIVQVTLTVNKKTPSITNFNDITKTYGDSLFTLNARSDSSGTITYTSSNTSVATISGNTVTIIGAGSANITLRQIETAYYSEVTKTITLTVNKKTPSLGTFAVSDKTYGIDASFSLTPPTSDSSGSFSYTSSNTSVATISGNVVTIRGAGGPVTITATQASTSNYNSASKSDTFTVNKGTTTLGAFTVSDKTYGDTPFTLTPPTSNRAGNFSYASSNTSVATISNNTVTIRGTGTTTITATQESTSNYDSATAQHDLTVNVKIFTIPSKTYTPSPLTTFTITSPVSSSLGSLMYASSNTSVATISGNSVTIRGAGTTTITVIQYNNYGNNNYGNNNYGNNNYGNNNYGNNNYGNNNYGNNNYGNETQNTIATATLTVIGITRSINNFTDISKTYGVDSSFTLNATSTPIGETILYSSSNTSVATISGNIVTIVGAGGPITITATLAPRQNYIDVSANVSLTVNKATRTISNFSNVSKTYGNQPFTLNAQTNGPGSISYTSADTRVATISGNTVTIIGAGNTSIRALLTETSDYSEVYIDASLNVNKATPTISNFTDISKTYGDIPFTLNAQTTGSGRITYTSADTNIATIDGNTVTINRVDSTQITATVAETNNYQSITSTITLTINQAASLNKFIIPEKQYKLQKNKPIVLIPRRYIFNENINSTWRIHPSLPEGMQFSKITGKITGTPTGSLEKQTYYIYKIKPNTTTYIIKFSVEI